MRKLPINTVMSEAFIQIRAVITYPVIVNIIVSLGIA